MRYVIFAARPIVEDLAGTLAFYLVFVVTGSAAFGVGIGLALGVGQIILHRWRGQPVPTLLALGIALTASLGGIALWTRDPRFVLLKPSIVYFCVAATMLPRGWVLRYVPPIARDLLPPRTLDLVGWGWAVLMGATALLNLLLVALFPPRFAAALFALFAAMSKLALFAAQYIVLRGRAQRAYRVRSAAAPIAPNP